MTQFQDQDIKNYNEDGYFFERELFNSEEINLLAETARNDHAMDKASSSMDDGEGNDVRLSLWNHPGKYYFCQYGTQFFENVREMYVLGTIFVAFVFVFFVDV